MEESNVHHKEQDTNPNNEHNAANEELEQEQPQNPERLSPKENSEETVEITPEEIPVEKTDEEQPDDVQSEDQEKTQPESEADSDAKQKEISVDISAILKELAALKETQQETARAIQELNELFSKRLMYVDHEEKIVDNMHRELQEYKNDLKFQLIQPILQDIISVADSISRMSESYLTQPEGEQDIPNDKFLSYIDDLHYIMENNGVDIYKSNIGDNVIPLKQRIIKKIETDDASLVGKIAKTYSYGYERNGKVITAEKVAVYVLKK